MPGGAATRVHGWVDRRRTVADPEFDTLTAPAFDGLLTEREGTRSQADNRDQEKQKANLVRSGSQTIIFLISWRRRR
jgi:hypothetical protein